MVDKVIEDELAGSFVNDNVNIALSKPTLNSSAYYDLLQYNSHAAVDGTPNTYWIPHTTNEEWMYVDLGSSVYIYSANVSWYPGCTVLSATSD